MADLALLTFENDRAKRRQSADQTIDFTAVRIGATNLTISETTGAFDFNAINITNAGTFNGVTVEGHAARHISGGADEIDGDQVDIDWVPTNYTRTTVPTEVTALEHLTAHLAGIDDALAGAAATEFTDDTFRITDDGNTTKKLAFEVSGVASSTTRTWTVPDLNLDFGTDFIRADGTIAFTANQSMGSNKITNLANGTAAGDAVNKAQLDSVAAGLDPKESVRICSTADIGGTYNASGGAGGTGEFTGVDLTASGNWDGLTGTGGSITLAVNDRLLVKSQTDAQQNGIYIVTTAGATGVIERAGDQDGSPSNEVSGGNYTFVENGSTCENNGFILQGDGILTLNTDDLDWVVYTGAGLITAGDGLAKSGNTLSVDLATDPGLEFATAQLRVKVKAGGGIVRDSDGLSVDTGDLTATLAGDGLVANGAALDVNPGDGIALVADAVVVDLAVDPGLEFDSGDLRVKVKAGGGVVRDSDGLSVDTGDLAATLAGDGLVANGAAIDVNPGDGIQLVSDAVAVDYTEAFTNDNAGAVTAGQIVYVKPDGDIDLAQATVADLDDAMIGVVEDASIASAASGDVYIRPGARIGGFSGLTIGNQVYVDRSTAGAVTQDSSTFVAGEFLYQVGRAITATEIIFDPRFILEM